MATSSTSGGNSLSRIHPAETAAFVAQALNSTINAVRPQKCPSCGKLQQFSWRRHLPKQQRRIGAAADKAATVTAVSDSVPSISQTTSTPSSLSEAQQGAWQECIQKVQDMGFTEVEAEQRVQRAFGWGAKARSYWRHEKNEQPANPQQIQAVIDFLSQQLGMTEQQLVKVIRLFPEVLGCDVQKQLQGNVDKLQKDWKLQGSVLTNAVLRQPPILGYNVDCEGNCVGECNRCWVRF